MNQWFGMNGHWCDFSTGMLRSLEDDWPLYRRVTLNFCLSWNNCPVLSTVLRTGKSLIPPGLTQLVLQFCFFFKYYAHFKIIIFHPLLHSTINYPPKDFRCLEGDKNKAATGRSHSSQLLQWIRILLYMFIFSLLMLLIESILSTKVHELLSKMVNIQ